MSAIDPSYRYIVRTPGVRGGHAHVEGTRIGVHDVIGLLQNGETVDSLISNCSGEIDVLVARQMSAVGDRVSDEI